MITSIDIGIRNFCVYVENNDKQCVLLEIFNLGAVNSGMRIYENLNEVVLHLNTYISNSSIILIEQQVKMNPKALKVQYVLVGILLGIGVSIKNIKIYPAYNKTKLLNAPANITKPQRKKWAVEMALLLLAEREDYDTFNIIANAPKKDDMADAFLQCYTFKLFYESRADKK